MGLLDDIFDSTVTVYPRTGLSARGIPGFGESYEVPCYVESGIKRVVNDKGEVIAASLFGMFKTDCGIEINHEIEYNSRRYRAAVIHPFACPDEEPHLEIHFQGRAQ